MVHVEVCYSNTCDQQYQKYSTDKVLTMVHVEVSMLQQYM